MTNSNGITWLRRARQKAGLTQAELGKLVGVTFISIHRWENGINKISAENAVRLADVLGISASKLRPDIFSRD